MWIPPDAIIAPDKIRRYLLIPRLIDDKSRYLARAGFDQSTATELEIAIRKVTAENDAIVERVNEHGTYYNVHGLLTGPNAMVLPVMLVWLQRLDGAFSFVTLIPD